MFTVSSIQLETARETKLRAWLAQPECQLLIDIITSRGKKHLAEASDKAMQASTYSQKEDSANSDLFKAVKCQDFLAMLSELKNSQEKLHIFNIK